MIYLIKIGMFIVRLNLSIAAFMMAVYMISAMRIYDMVCSYWYDIRSYQGYLMSRYVTATDTDGDFEDNIFDD